MENRDKYLIIVITIALFLGFFIVLGMHIHFVATLEPKPKEAVEARKNQNKVQIGINADLVVSRILYARDKRTDLCFAYSELLFEFSITEVPCEKVQHLLQDNQK